MSGTIEHGREAYEGGYGCALEAPEYCPFCGGYYMGGGTRVAYYGCGAHLWTVPGHDGRGELRGHPGGTPDCPPKEATK